MQPHSLAMLTALAISTTIFTPVQAQHSGDVQVQVESGQIVIGSAELDAGDNTTSVTVGERVFSDYLLSNFRSSDPGFNSDGTGSPVLPPGITGFSGLTDLMFDILPTEINGSTANFFYWDGLDQGANGVGPEDVDFGLAAPGVTWTLVDDDFDFYTADGSANFVPGGLLGTISASGRLHNHLPFAVDDGDGNINTTADEGLYLAAIQVRATGYANSEPLFFVHASPTISQAVLDVATNWVDDNYLLITGMNVPGDFDGDGFVGLADLNILGANWGTMSGNPFDPGDANGDGNVDLADLNLIGANWSPPPTVAVPEPHAAVLLLSSTLLLVRRKS